jgi:hypothetical protein
VAEKTVKLIAQIPPDLHAMLKAEAERDERSITGVVRRILRNYFDAQARRP